MIGHVYPRGSFFHSLAGIKGKHILVMGLGLNGGGEAAVRFFLRHGAFVTVTDMKDEDALRPTITAILENPPIEAALMPSRLTLHLGAHAIEDFTACDCVIKNPAVKFEGNKYLAAAEKAHVAIESDISTFLSLSPAAILAVTGSKGKSTTVSILHWILSCTLSPSRTFLGGNITVSPLSFLEETTASSAVVLELSSWQLADLRGRSLLHPRVSAITKIVPDHQNWYGDMDSYVADKRLIFEGAEAGSCAIFDSDSWGGSFACAVPHGVRVLRYKEKDTPLETNKSIAILAAAAYGIPEDKAIAAAASWPGLPHRLQFFHKCVLLFDGGVSASTLRFYDDSCATVCEAAAASVKAFSRPILIAGGTDKGLGQEALAEVIAQGIPLATYLLEGSATDILTALLPKGCYHGPFPSLEALLRQLKSDLMPASCEGDCEAISLNTSALEAEGEIDVVFSPGSTSFGMFANEFQRGECFQSAVKALFP